VSSAADVTVLVVSADDARRERAAAALNELGRVVVTGDMGGALEELSLGQPMIVVIDGSLPKDVVTGLLGAVGDPDRTVLWVAEPTIELLAYGTFMQIPHGFDDPLLTGAAQQLLALQRLKTDAREAKDQLRRYDYLAEAVAEARHGINSPLTAIMAEAELLLMDEDLLTEEQKGSLETIEAMAKRIAEYVDRLRTIKTEK
jgi:signal transduction histidine kinase